MTDAANLDMMLSELRLPTFRHTWRRFAENSDTEGWPAAKLIAALAELELADRERRRTERHMRDAKLLPGKSLDNFDFAAVPTLSKPKVRALADGRPWIENGDNLLLFGPPGTGKSHLACAIGAAIVEAGWRVCFMRTTDLVQRLQCARRDLILENALKKLDRFHLLILDDFAYVPKDQAETSVIFELISARYERRSMLITANQPFEEWTKLFPDKTTTVAAVDRLIHHASILEMNTESYRKKSALARLKATAKKPPARSEKQTGA